MATNKQTREWAGLGKKLHSQPIPERPIVRKEFIVMARRQGSSLYISLPAPLRKDLGIYESSPVRIVQEGKSLRLTRLETITASQIDLLKAQYPQAHIPWAKKLHLLGRAHPAQQYELRGLPITGLSPILSGGQEPGS
jgi:hypothetical protein